MQSLGPRYDKWLFCGAVSFCALGLMTYPNALLDLRYDRAALLSGQWWRVVTGHLVHLNFDHLLLNLAGLILVCELLWYRLPWRHGSALLLFSAAGTSLLLWWLHPELAWYAGLSGALHGLWAGCALAGLWGMQSRNSASAVMPLSAIDGVIRFRRLPSRYFFAGALILLVLKLSADAWFGPSSYIERMIEGRIISVAHWYGALAGTAYLLIWRCAAGIGCRK